MTIFWLIFSGNSHTLPGCLPFIKKFRKILVGYFGSVKTVRVVPKISGLSRRASRLDSCYKMKLVRNSRNLMHQSAPPPPATADHLPALSVPGLGHLQILCCPGPFPSFRHARGFLSEYNYTDDFTGKSRKPSRLAPLSRTGMLRQKWQNIKDATL